MQEGLHTMTCAGPEKVVRPCKMQAERREDQSHEGEAGRGGVAYCYFMI